MAKIVFMIYLVVVFADAKEIDLDQNCLSCHQNHQIPDEMIYKRYLVKYSTDKRMQDAIYNYLKEPNKDHSIMPKLFFTKFPMKPKIDLKDDILKSSIMKYIEKYDIKKRLTLEE